MEDSVESFNEMENFKNGEGAEIDWANKYAMYISREYGKTLKERRAFILGQNLTADDIFDIDRYAELMNHGVEEKFRVKCKECGHVTEIPHSVGVLDFFPDTNRGRNHK
jgi:ribosomal protein L30E